MGIRHWLRERMLGEDVEGDDAPPASSLVRSLLGQEEERVRSLGTYRAHSYPKDLSSLVRRRQAVTEKLLRIDIADRDARIEAIPKLQEMLREYPHPLVYETLIHAYVDAGRYDEAKGVAFAARERRVECRRSEHPEIRAEIDRLNEWNPDEIDALRAEREARAR